MQNGDEKLSSVYKNLIFFLKVFLISLVRGHSSQRTFREELNEICTGNLVVYIYNYLGLKQTVGSNSQTYTIPFIIEAFLYNGSMSGNVNMKIKYKFT